MDDQFKKNGTSSWCELMTTDVEKAKAFYTELFGWDAEDISMPGMPYTLVKAGGKGIGGIMPIPKDAQSMPPMWGAYVTVDDVDAIARTAEKLGAKLLVKPRNIPGVGRFCVIQDQQGAAINAITYKKT